MKKPTRPFLWIPLSTLFILSACQKEYENNVEIETENSSLRNTGLILSDLTTLSRNPLIVSTEYLKKQNVALALVRTAPAKGKPPKNSGDKTVPEVSITSPVNGSEVSGVVNINATATDNIAVASVSLYINTS